MSSTKTNYKAAKMWNKSKNVTFLRCFTIFNALCITYYLFQKEFYAHVLWQFEIGDNMQLLKVECTVDSRWKYVVPYNRENTPNSKTTLTCK